MHMNSFKKLFVYKKDKKLNLNYKRILTMLESCNFQLLMKINRYCKIKII